MIKVDTFQSAGPTFAVAGRRRRHGNGSFTFLGDSPLTEGETR